VTLEAVEITEAVTIMDGAFPVEVTLSVLLVRGTLLDAAISGAGVAVSVPVALTVMVRKMARACWMLVEEAVAVAVATSVALAVTVLVGNRWSATVMAAETLDFEAVAQAEVETDKLPDSLLVGWRSAVVELTLHDPESDWDAVTVAMRLGVKVGVATRILGSSFASKLSVVSHTRMCNLNRRMIKMT